LTLGTARFMNMLGTHSAVQYGGSIVLVNIELRVMDDHSFSV